MTISTISPQLLHTRLREGQSIDVIDVRTPVEYRAVHAEGARLVPLDRLNPNDLAASCGGRVMAILCKSGGRARKACEALIAAGHADVLLVEGGTDAWVAAGLPVNRGQQAMSLERQVRIAAGALVLLGAILGLTVHPYALALSAFVGAGLVFAGITGSCAMGVILAKMPWNQVAGESRPTCANTRSAA